LQGGRAVDGCGGVAVVGLAAAGQTRESQRLGSDGGAGRALDGQGVVACFGTGK
jgi:hypothetical protein